MIKSDLVKVSVKVRLKGLILYISEFQGCHPTMMLTAGSGMAGRMLT